MTWFFILRYAAIGAAIVIAVLLIVYLRGQIRNAQRRDE
jgi:hypothetical protein